MEESNSENSAAEINGKQNSPDDGVSTEKESIIKRERDPRFFPPIANSNLRNNSYSRFITYAIKRTKNVTWKGFRYHYQIEFQGNPLYHSKTKTKKPSDPIWISHGTEMHFSQSKFEACLLSNNDQSLFSLRQDNEYGKEMMTVEVTTISPSQPRITVMNVFEKMEFVPSRVESLKPTLSKRGTWELSFLNKPCIPSIKNCILVGSDSLPYFMARRVSDEVLEVDSPQIFPSICVFGLAISLWIS